MAEVDFEKIEEELGLVVPNIYKMFIGAVQEKGIDLKAHGISYDTDSIVAGNIALRLRLGDQKPKWKDHFFDFGVGDGCGNFFFLIAKKEEDDVIKLWAHDPSGIEKVSSATKFLGQLIEEIEAAFQGANRNRFQGNGFNL